MFQRLASAELTALGATSLPVLVVQHPLGGEPLEGVQKRIAQAVDQLAGLLAAPAAASAPTAPVPSAASRPAVEDRPRPSSAAAKPATLSLEEDEVYAEFVRREWCDGLSDHRAHRRARPRDARGR